MTGGVGVTPLVAGHCMNVGAHTERGGAWRVRRYPAGFALLHHPERGPVLFDTGYSERVRALMRRWPGVLYGAVTPVRLAPGEAAADQLRALGIKPAEVQHVIVSHLHADHVGGLRDFPRARIHLDGAGLRALAPLRGVRAVRRAFLPDLLPDDLAQRAEALAFRTAPPGLDPFETSADVFGDGTVHALPVPGHAPGMVALVVRRAPDAALTGDGAGLVLLAADAAWSVRALRRGLDVPALARLAFWNPAQERASAGRLRAWITAHPRVRVIVSHDDPEVDRA
ncbi:glyoxylase-like metal-dependent hydrolase (beta-lactamase superfamily II) [Deinococcus metalli]|uniref:Glyoxylase-like metal-dependent hydrolase (Beta-lactamase superfamily II) n=1 Tax=Deinococcus metalli TaxID=1141878 RepID=A0A7W8NQI1_9DEIO|nr:MBL fold metallo-hydrolase [Deinococcus metalli]MBB5375888.1 glyoxylase-like metal-dependent hydrolase (beta-lactamase superfamily II) [Deinococcus metalli]GHF36290.1 MBL fold metallo-hydrolase [Deinococcus metalli]